MKYLLWLEIAFMSGISFAGCEHSIEDGTIHQLYFDFRCGEPDAFGLSYDMGIDDHTHGDIGGCL